MLCPVCNINLVLSDRNGIEIDYCPQCRGVWLDRGELDKIIERGNRPRDHREHDRDDDRYEERHDSRDHHDSRHDNHHSSQRRHKKESFLGDLFDFS